MKVGLPISFDDNVLDDETREKIRPLIDFVNKSNKTIVQTLQKNISLIDNVSCTLKSITCKHGLKQNISGSGIGAIIISSDSSIPINSQSILKTNGGYDVTIYFKEETYKGEPTESNITIVIFGN